MSVIFPLSASGEEVPATPNHQTDNIGVFEATQRRLDQYRADQAHWDSLIRGQRKGHNFSLSWDRTYPYWVFTHPVLADSQTKLKLKPAYVAKFQYEFHIPVHKGFGYYLGSNVGYTFGQRGYSDDVKVDDIIQLPGVTAGVFLNVSSAIRCGLNAQGYLERVEKLSVPFSVGANLQREDMYFNTRAWAIGMTLDLFFKLEWAIRFEVEGMAANYTPVNGITDDIVMDRYISRNEIRYGVGLLFHSI